MPELIIKRAGEGLRRRSLDSGTVVLGRDPACDLVLASSFVSRQHARLERKADAYELVDLGSRNGVLVNGHRLRGSHRLKKGDEIAVGDFVITYWETALGDSTLQFTKEDREAVLRLDAGAKEVWLGLSRLEVRLSPQEFSLLAFLYEKKGTVQSREEIGDHIWGVEVVGGGALPRYDNNMVHRLMFRLKTKLAAVLDVESYLRNVPGMGYRLDERPS